MIQLVMNGILSILNYKYILSILQYKYILSILQYKYILRLLQYIKERKLDYWFSYKLNTQQEVELIMPEGYSVNNMPPNVIIKNNDYEFVATLTKLQNKIVYKKSIIIKNALLKKSKFEQWNRDIEKLNIFYNEQIVLTKK